MNTSKKLLALLSLLFIGILFSPVTAQKWAKYQAESCECQIKFPSEPEVEITNGEDKTSYDVQVYVGEQKLYLGYTIHTTPMIDPIDLAQVSLDAFSGALKGKIVREKSWEVNGYTGRQATINLQDQGRVCMYKSIFKDQIQFQVFSIGDLKTFDSDLAKEFFDSFKLKN